MAPLSDEELLALTLKELGEERLSMADFDSRMTLQKKVYFVQEFGVNLGYWFSWYIRGPYCSDLADHGFSLEEAYDETMEETSEYSFKKSTAEKTAQMKLFLEGFDDPFNLELLASLHYLAKYSHPPEVSFDRVKRQLLASKSRYVGKDDEIESAWNRLKEFDLV